MAGLIEDRMCYQMAQQRRHLCAGKCRVAQCVDQVIQRFNVLAVHQNVEKLLQVWAVRFVVRTGTLHR